MAGFSCLDIVTVIVIQSKSTEKSKFLLFLFGGIISVVVEILRHLGCTRSVRLFWNDRNTSIKGVHSSRRVEGIPGVRV
jgi:hypothetical protein